MSDYIHNFIYTNNRYSIGDGHDADHHWEVVKIFHQMLEIEDLTQDEIDFCEKLISVHDMVDYKYTELIEKNIDFVKEFVGQDGLYIVQNISYSKKDRPYDGPFKKLRDLVMLADWIAGLNLQRCIDYSKNNRQRVITTYYNRILPIINFIPKKYEYIYKPLYNKVVSDFEQYSKM